VYERQTIEQQILALLPDDGSPVLNRVMMALIGRRLGARIEPETYFLAVDALSTAGIVVRHRGQGGGIARMSPPQRDEPVRAIAWPESRLMPSLGRYLRTLFWRGLDLPVGAYWKVVDTSAHGPQEKWGRPDFTAISTMPLKVLGRAEVSVYAFELKAELGADLTAVHQALAQTRMTHFGYLVWHLPEGSMQAAKLPALMEQCRRHGIGLILIRDPDLVETWSVEVDPERQATPLGAIDEFLAARLSPSDCDEIRQRLRELKAWHKWWRSPI
jgi:hypothetical protein